MTNPAPSPAGLGQLPSPEIAAEWEKISPGSIKKFFDIVDAETVRRADELDRAGAHERTMAWCSLWCGVGLAVMYFGAAVGFFAVGVPIAGGCFAGAPAATIIAKVLGSGH